MFKNLLTKGDQNEKNHQKSERPGNHGVRHHLKPGGYLLPSGRQTVWFSHSRKNSRDEGAGDKRD